MLTQLTGATTAAARDRHRALILLTSPPEGALSDFAASHQLPFIGAAHAADRADRITEVLGSEFDILIHETHDHIDAGLLAALTGTIKAGGVLVLGLPFPHSVKTSTSSLNHFNRRFIRLLSEMTLRFPDKVQWLRQPLSPDLFAELSTQKSIGMGSDTISPAQAPPANCPALSWTTAHQEQDALLKSACDYLNNHAQGCITITGRRGRGKSALLGHIAGWLDKQDITFAVTAARRSALTSLQRHSSAHCDFLAPAGAQGSGCQVLLVDEASSLPLSMLEGFLDTHQHVIYCSTVEGYENAGRAFALRFGQILKKRYVHNLTLQPDTPWRWDAGDPLEYLIDTLLMGGNSKDARTPRPPATEHTAVACQEHSDAHTGLSPCGGSIRLLDRAALALDEPLLRQVYGLLRDTHYQTSATDLSHMLDAPDLQLWVLEESGQVKAALMLVLEGDIDTCLHEAIVSKQRRLPHQLLPQLLAQSANEARALAAKYGRVIRIAVVDPDRRRGLGSRLLRAVECATMTHGGPASGFGASFASDPVSLAFWLRNGYTQFHTGFKSNPRTGKPAIAVIKSQGPALDSVVQSAVSIHDDNLRWIHDDPQKTDSQLQDAALLQRFIKGQRSVHDTFAALSRLASQHQLPLQHKPDIARRRYEAILRKAVTAALE
ncbi:GNAT family N-acetyltransferase [Granulosicoccus antarcticus]|uniref:tRNA(Met) cytidine acetyltransferase TmcA n=1 Tax=Granulosicoccus antarcticus IMCC3135 TaxID=1192854 RepID=A0A2Z2NKL8_9GAMM|nr:GNAT family N-acetyltransferase [Granulosicoccus antarcticus]ASJ71709.1 tRNA(Met) cytidine acetyltransferase TmcA [Granulosicoccus antarcticus IMCC3135]